MKKLIFILLFLPLTILSQVPDNETFTLDTVRKVLGLKASTNLSECFFYADLSPEGYDEDYNNSGYAPEGSLLRFRNYYCVYPSGLTEYTFYHGAYCDGGQMDFYQSLELTEEVCSGTENIDPNCYANTGYNYYLFSIDVGERFYGSELWECRSPSVADGYYLVDINNDYDFYIVHVVNNFIESITDCP